MNTGNLGSSYIAPEENPGIRCSQGRQLSFEPAMPVVAGGPVSYHALPSVRTGGIKSMRDSRRQFVDRGVRPATTPFLMSDLNTNTPREN